MPKYSKDSQNWDISNFFKSTDIYYLSQLSFVRMMKNQKDLDQKNILE